MTADDPAELGTATGPVPADPRTAEFSAFYREHTPRLVRYLMMLGAPAALAADLAQDTMALLWRDWDAVDSPRAWTRTVAGRAYLRYVTRVPELPVDVAADPGPLIGAAEAAAVEARHDLLRLLRDLAPRERQVLALTYDGDTPAEIAALLGIAEATVRSVQRHARAKLAEHREDLR